MEKLNSVIDFLKVLQAKGVPEKEYGKHIGRYFEFAAREKLIPLSGNFELTPFCNLDCKMCYVHLDSQKFMHSKLLPVNVWKDLIDQAYASGMRKVILTGGECLTYPGFNDIYLHLRDKGILTAVLSNGILLDESRVDFFKRYPPHRIQISVYGSNDDAYEKVTGKRVSNIVYKNINLLQEAGLSVKIALTPNRFMLEDSIALLDRVEGLGLPYNINSILFTPRENTGRKNEDAPIEEYIKLYKRYNRLKNISDYEQIDFKELPEENHNPKNCYGVPCGAGKSTFTIKYDGTMCPCISLSEITANPLEIGFKKAWEFINVCAKEYAMPAECGGCNYVSVCPKCAAMHKEAPIKGHCDPRICERTKKLIGAGIVPMPKEVDEMINNLNKR